MPTVRQNIAYAYNGFMSRHRLAAVHLIKSALAIVLISLLLEIEKYLTMDLVNL